MTTDENKSAGVSRKRECTGSSEKLKKLNLVKSTKTLLLAKFGEKR